MISKEEARILKYSIRRLVSLEVGLRSSKYYGKPAEREKVKVKISIAKRKMYLIIDRNTEDV